MTVSARRQLSAGWMLFILTGLNLFNYLDRYVLGAVLTPLKDDLGVSDGDAGRLVTAFMIGYFVTSPIFGWLGDRCSRKWLIAAGIFVWSLGTILTGFAGTFVNMLLFRAMVGLGEASYATISPSLISDTYGPQKRNNALTIFYVAIPIGAALGTMIGGWIAAKWGWRHAFIWAGAPGLLLAMVLLPFAEPVRGQGEGRSDEAALKPTFKEIFSLLRIPDYVLVVLGYTAYTFALGAFATWGPSFLQRVHYMKTEEATNFFGPVLFMAGLFGTMIGGFAATAWHKRNPAGYAWTLGLSVLVATPLAVAAFKADDEVWAKVLLAVTMFFVFLPTGPVNTLILETVPVNLRASAMAGSIFAIHLFGDMWSTEIVGRVADAAGGDLQKAVLILPVALAVGAALWLALALKTKRAASRAATVTGSVSDFHDGFARWFLQGVLWFVTRLIYRVKVVGHYNVPKQGGALFVCNHVSFVDALLLIASTKRHVRFMMFKGTYELWYIKPFARILGIIPISSEQRPRDMIKSLQTASQAIRDGHLVCIFAEGQITRIGQLLPFRRGMERIMKDVAAPIVPVALSGVWGSIFSFKKRRFLWKLPRKFPYPVTVSFGAQMPPATSAMEVRQAVQEMQAAAWQDRRRFMKPLHRAFVRTARRHPRRFAMADLQTPNVSFGSALVRTIFLARRLKKVWAGQKMVGLLLPPSVPGALANYAALLSGKIPVNLNYTVSEQTLASCIQQCEIKTVLTSKVFLEKVKLKVAGDVVFLEDVMAPVKSVGEKLKAFLMACLVPTGFLERALQSGGVAPAAVSAGFESGKIFATRASPLDELATVIFSSGSTGEPKGVMLSHFNVISNVEQMEQVFGLDKRDRVLGILPFFHSFGFTGTLCTPAVLGMGVAYHPNPLDAKMIGPLTNEYALTLLLATPTFLQLYMRGCDPADFGSLRIVMTGAEKLPERLATAFDERFGIRPLEGYGCTECGPAVSVNTHDFRSAGFRQVGAKRGKIGHPLPGVSVRIVDPENADGPPLPMDQAGLLLVRGPNVMQGYLGKPEKTAEVIRNGWYVTGDIAALDEDGFLQITDRLSRFSKIGGEMVPHIKVEEKLHELAAATEQSFVVTSVADEKKGERLVVLHKLADDKLQPVVEKLGTSDLPNLWKPKADAFVRVESFPMLGTGKLDLRKVKEIAGAQNNQSAAT